MFNSPKKTSDFSYAQHFVHLSCEIIVIYDILRVIKRPGDLMRWSEIYLS